jgi:DNA-binding NtrC family response regulator
MNESGTRGGNSRALGKALDQLPYPIAMLDRRGGIVFVNQAMCAMARADARQLTGLHCRWEVAADDVPFGAILMALAPPAGALEGKLVARRLTVPIVYGSTATGQLFVPLIDNENVAQLTMVVLGDWELLHQQLPMVHSTLHTSLNRTAERMLVELRSGWRSLDHLLGLLGDSPAIRLAMSRAQLAIASDCHCLVTGPAGLGKSQLMSGIHVGRLRRLGVNVVAGHWMPLDCAALTADLFDAMLDVFEGRLKAQLPAAAQLLLLENLEALTPHSARALHRWLEQHAGRCVAGGISALSRSQLLLRGADWQSLLALLSQVEIEVPPLRDRPGDIAILAQHLLSEACRRSDRAQLILSPQAVDLLTVFPWPDNVRQLVAAMETTVQHAVLTASIQPQHLPAEIRTYASSVHRSEKVEPIVLDQVLEDTERVLIRRALQLSPRNRAQAARLLGISRPRLLRRIEQLGLDVQPETGLADDVEAPR